MGQPIKSITIVGGGTSGWLAATFLARLSQSQIKSGALEITLIESPNIPIIGVGEATSPGLPHMFRMLGLNETKLIKKANIAFKLSGYFDGWNVHKDGTPRTWTNPFMTRSSIAGRSSGHYFLKYGRDGNGASDFTSVISPCPEMIAAMRGPRPIGAQDYDGTLAYAYHMDALVIATELRDLGVSLGVNHILDDVVKVNLDERGFVSSLDLKEHGSHPIELVIDSTGFAGVIINKTLKEPFDPFDKYLPNDRAAVMQIPHEDPSKIEPISRATALGNGWVFNVPLYNRIGTGYVYASQYISDEEASAALIQHVGARAEGKEPRIIRMRIGKSRRSWVKNCIAIGLSSGFAEPLEATAIHSVDLALRWFYTHFPDSDFSPALQDAYNKRIDEFYEEIIDFIALHFYLNNRNDTEYWRAAREDRPIPPSLVEKLELWRHKLPYSGDLKSEHFFSPTSYMAALMGKGFYDDHAPELPGVDEPEWRQFLEMSKAQNQQLGAQLPDHAALLRHIRGEAPAPQPMQNTGFQAPRMSINMRVK
ncbi:MAG: tryptophan halogenase [Hyphococcus sp.]|nr:MAG: tryptophan halogenase [Marinicaulis sp.]